MSESESTEVLIRPEIQSRLKMLDKILAGDYGKDPIPNDLDPETTFSGPVLELEDNMLTEPEVALLYKWITNILGDRPENAEVSKTLQSPQRDTEVDIFKKKIGDGWYLSKWIIKDKQPSYIFWREDAYEFLEMDGYEQI